MWHVVNDEDDIQSPSWRWILIIWPTQFGGSKRLREFVELWCGTLAFSQSGITFEENSGIINTVDIVFNRNHI